MDFNINTTGSTGIGFLVVIGVLWGVFVTVFYMVVAWRAMRAHELISHVLMRDLQLKYGHAESTPSG
jgi:hypothetical protein